VSDPPDLKVVPIVGAADLTAALRAIADELEEGKYGRTDQVTVIFPGASEIFQLGSVHDDQAVSDMCFNAVCALVKMANMVVLDDNS